MVPKNQFRISLIMYWAEKIIISYIYQPLSSKVLISNISINFEYNNYDITYIIHNLIYFIRGDNYE